MRIFAIATFIFLGVVTPADAATSSLSCDGFTVTADLGTYIFVGRDAEPPMLLTEGATRTYPFWQMSNAPLVDHSYALIIFDQATGAKLDSKYETIQNCPTIAFPAGDDPKNAEPPGIKLIPPVVAVADPPVVQEVLAVRKLNGPW